MTILIVDDNEPNRYQLEVLLAGSGYQVVTAVNGAEALAKARQNPPDLIVSDILMPVMDGFVLCREWKKDERLRQIPFVFYTATYTDERDRKLALSLGAELFFVKPDDAEVFMRTIREVIQQAQRLPAASDRVPIEAPQQEEGAYLKQYNETLIRKLETKMEQLERANRELEANITERKKAQDELQQAYTELKETQAQLIQASKMSALGQLAGGVAHELNNPLTGVLNNVQLIKMEAEAKKEFNLNDFKELIGVIESSALRCKKITQSLLGFSYAAKGKLSPLSLNELADKAIDLVLQELRLQNVVFNKELQPDLPLILGDFQLLQQVVFGLINNAHWAIGKKSQEGGIITIRTSHDPKEKTVTLSVSDRGIGISEKNMKKLFTPFFTTKEVGEGTGLGLALFYNIVKSQNGDIKVDSKEGEGTTVSMKFPYYSKPPL